jgi:hypothetical protein
VYHPTVGRWTTRDPAGYVDGHGLHQYARSMPTRVTDLFGLFVQEGGIIDDVDKDLIQNGIRPIERLPKVFSDSCHSQLARLCQARATGCDANQITCAIKKEL